MALRRSNVSQPSTSSTGRSGKLRVCAAASSTPGQGSTAQKGASPAPGASVSQPSGSLSGLSVRAAQLTPSERRVLAESVAGVLQQPIGQQRPHQETSRPGSSNPRAAEELAWVFSYGANMSFEMLSKRDVLVSVVGRDAAFVVNPRVRLVFKHRGGQATLEALPEGAEPRFRPLGAARGQPCVHGVLYRVPVSALKQLHTRDQGYTVTQMQVETYDGLRVAANVFVSGPLAKLPEEVVPPESYMRRLREGAGFNFLDPVYQAWLSSIETVPSAGLGSEYFNTPGRYISYSLLLMSLVVVGGWMAQHW